MTDCSERRSVGVVVERQRIDNPWVDARWRVVGLLPALPDRAPWTVLAESPDRTDYYAGTAEVALHPTEAENYKENLASARPSLYVILRRCAEEPGLRLHAVTADPGEVDAHSDAGDDLIEALPLPADLAAWMQDFVARHYIDRPFYKRQRDRADPEALATRRPVSRPENKHG
ncbi:DUF3305 domain-containing protein [Azospirillum sp. sgz302134]